LWNIVPRENSAKYYLRNENKGGGFFYILHELKYLEGFGLEKQVRKFGLTKTFGFGLGLVDM